MNIESLVTIIGEVIALRVLYKIGYIKVVTSKMQNSMLTAALSGKIVRLRGHRIRKFVDRKMS